MTFLASPLGRNFAPQDNTIILTFAKNTNPQPGFNLGTPVPIPLTLRNRTAFLQGYSILDSVGNNGEAVYLLSALDDAGIKIAEPAVWRGTFVTGEQGNAYVGRFLFIENRFASFRVDVFFQTNLADFDFNGGLQVV